MSLRVLLFISAALNVLLIGAMIGFFAGGGFGAARSAQAGVALSSPRAVLAAMPPDVRREIRRDLARAWLQARDERLALRQANQDVTRLLEAEHYDAAAMQDALRRQREAGAALIARFHDAIAEDVARLTPEQRRAVAQALATGRRARAERLLDNAFPDEADPAP